MNRCVVCGNRTTFCVCPGGAMAPPPLPPPSDPADALAHLRTLVGDDAPSIWDEDYGSTCAYCHAAGWLIAKTFLDNLPPEPTR